MPVADAAGWGTNTHVQLAEVAEAVEKMNRISLDFDGLFLRRVNFGSSTGAVQYRYRVRGSRLELIADRNGQTSIIPMTIEPDGSIRYLTLRFYKQ